MSFADIIGQETALAALRAAVAHDNIPQAYLFLGPDGVGKMTAAVEFAKALNCAQREPGEGDACDACVNCTRIAADQHPDVQRIAPDGEQTKIWQFWTRSGHPPGALESINFAPVAAPRRVYLIERAETLNEEAANSILKALEEPPPYVHFVLCAPSQTAVLPTILSRCQLIRFRQVPQDRLADALTARKALDPEEARLLAAYAEGAPGRALRLAETPELRGQREALLDLAARIADSPVIAAFRLAEDLRAAAKTKAKKGEDDGEADRTARGDLTRALDVLMAWHRDLLALSLRGPDAPIVHTDQRAALLIAARRYAPDQIAQNVEALFAFRRHVERNANAQLATEVLMLRLVPRKTPAAPGADKAPPPVPKRS
uniref:DNA polymerase III delta prime subunit n=1 Tax=uncultured Armatimonadetes bacterium TaxID=157466 RepID=A0A6J4HDI9_9BACT|nr:DNA polymerase III delta prime subunit [uncultured Armatimonadetes bacterium]